MCFCLLSHLLFFSSISFFSGALQSLEYFHKGKLICLAQWSPRLSCLVNCAVKLFSGQFRVILKVDSGTFLQPLLHSLICWWGSDRKHKNDKWMKWIWSYLIHFKKWVFNHWCYVAIKFPHDDDDIARRRRKLWWWWGSCWWNWWLWLERSW